MNTEKNELLSWSVRRVVTDKVRYYLSVNYKDMIKNKVIEVFSEYDNQMTLHMNVIKDSESPLLLNACNSPLPLNLYIASTYQCKIFKFRDLLHIYQLHSHDIFCPNDAFSILKDFYKSDPNKEKWDFGTYIKEEL